MYLALNYIFFKYIKLYISRNKSAYLTDLLIFNSVVKYPISIKGVNFLKTMQRHKKKGLFNRKFVSLFSF